MYGSGVRNKSCFQPGPLLRNESGSDLRKVEEDSQVVILGRGIHRRQGLGSLFQPPDVGWWGGWLCRTIPRQAPETHGGGRQPNHSHTCKELLPSSIVWHLLLRDWQPGWPDRMVSALPGMAATGLRFPAATPSWIPTIRPNHRPSQETRNKPCASLPAWPARARSGSHGGALGGVQRIASAFLGSPCAFSNPAVCQASYAATCMRVFLNCCECY